MEFRITCLILGFLEEDQLIARQYGFYRCRLADDLLTYFTNRWREAVECKADALPVDLDVAKTFNQVWHKALLCKSTTYGLLGKFETEQLIFLRIGPLGLPNPWQLVSHKTACFLPRCFFSRLVGLNSTKHKYGLTWITVLSSGLGHHITATPLSHPVQ